MRGCNKRKRMKSSYRESDAGKGETKLVKVVFNNTQKLLFWILTNDAYFECISIFVIKKVNLKVTVTYLKNRSLKCPCSRKVACLTWSLGIFNTAVGHAQHGHRACSTWPLGGFCMAFGQMRITNAPAGSKKA